MRHRNIEDFAVTQDQMENVARTIYNFMPPTPQYNWPLLSQRVGTEVWVKHENHTPTGAFKIRGGLVYVDYLRGQRNASFEFIAATRVITGKVLPQRRLTKGFPPRLLFLRETLRKKTVLWLHRERRF